MPYCGHPSDARKQVNHRVVPVRAALKESVTLAHEVYCHVFRILREKIKGDWAEELDDPASFPLYSLV